VEFEEIDGNIERKYRQTFLAHFFPMDFSKILQSHSRNQAGGMMGG